MKTNQANSGARALSHRCRERALCGAGLAVVVSALGATMPVAAQEFTFQAEPAAALWLDSPQSDRFTPGFYLALRPGISLGRVVGLQWSASMLLVPAGQGYTETGSADALTAGVRLRPFGTLSAEPERLAGLFIDGNLGYVRTGDLNRFGFDAGLGYNFHAAPWFAVGPVVRYSQIVQPDDIEDKDPNDAQYLSVGLNLAFGTVKKEEPMQECPVTPSELTVIVQDPTGKPIPNASVTMDNRVATSGSDGRAEFADATPGASEKVTAQAPTFQPATTEPFALVVGQNQQVIVLSPMDSQLKVVVTDEKGMPHDARVRFLGGPSDQGPVQVGTDGEETITLKPGDWRVLVADPDHVPQEAKVSLAPGEFQTLTVRFTSDKPINVCKEAVVLRNINFDFDLDTPRADSLPVLQTIARSLLDCPDVAVQIGGYTDSKGSDAYNMDLSQRRMNAVKQILAGEGVADARLTAKGFGETHPIATNKTEAGRALNRRVEFLPLTGATVVMPPTAVPADGKSKDPR